MAIDISELSVSELRRVEDGSAILLALADLLESKGALVYADQVRNDARAVQLLTQDHPSATDPAGIASFAVPEHRSEILNKLR